MVDIATIEAKEMDARGRPCKYETHVEPYLDKIFEWLKTGYTDCSIAEQLGIHQNTWMRYRDKYSILGELYARARAHRNALVMNKMYERATGYQHPDLFIAQNKGEIVKEEIIKHYPPDVQAADLFLRNNDPDYKSAKSVDSGQNITVNFQLPQLEAELSQIAEKRKSLEALLHKDYEVIE